MVLTHFALRDDHCGRRVENSLFVSLKLQRQTGHPGLGSKDNLRQKLMVTSHSVTAAKQPVEMQHEVAVAANAPRFKYIPPTPFAGVVSQVGLSFNTAVLPAEAVYVLTSQPVYTGYYLQSVYASQANDSVWTELLLT